MPQTGFPFGLLRTAGAAALLQPSPDDRLRHILWRESVDVGPLSPVWSALRKLEPCLSVWANGFVDAVTPSGSFAKGTAVKSGTDFDLFISIRPSVPNTLKEIHDTLFNQLHSRGLQPKRQNVSIGVSIGGLSIDLVPGRQIRWLASDHNLFNKKTGTWRKTNVAEHVQYVTAANRSDEIRLIKVWRNQLSLEFPSFYLELAVIRALEGCVDQSLSARATRVLRYLATAFPHHRFVDPANTANVISDDMTQTEKSLVQQAAQSSLLTWPYSIR